jgi:NTP pyrophosphatase (non-canonical NTP hydrolase)
VLTLTEVDYSIEEKINAINNSGQAINLSWVINTISNIYPSNRAILFRCGQAFVVGKMIEEAEELYRAFSGLLRGTGTKKELADEIADLSAWVISCWDLSSSQKNIDSEFDNIFRRGCPECKRPKCTCKPYHIGLTLSVIVSDLHKVLKRIRDVGLAKQSIQVAIEVTQDVNRNIDLPLIRSSVGAVFDEISSEKLTEPVSIEEANRLVAVREKLDDMMRNS